MNTHKYILPEIPPSWNLYAGRQNTWQYRNEKKLWMQKVWAYCRPAPKKPLDKAVVELKYFFPTKIRHDPDNYAGKFILDGLVHSGIIKDDSFDCIELRVKGACDKENPRVEIIVSEV